MSTITPEPGAAEAVPETVYVGRAPDPKWGDDRDMDTVIRARNLHPIETYPKWSISIDGDNAFTVYACDIPPLIAFLGTLPAIEGGDAK